MKKDNIYFPILFFSTLALGVLLGSLLNFPVPGNGLTQNAHKDKLNKLIDLIVNNILDKLDPHSVYIAQNEMEEVSQSMRGDFVGIGINFFMYKDTVSIIKPVEGGPSEKAGIKAGDRILFAGKDKLFGKKFT